MAGLNDLKDKAKDKFDDMTNRDHSGDTGMSNDTMTDGNSGMIDDRMSDTRMQDDAINADRGDNKTRRDSDSPM